MKKGYVISLLAALVLCITSCGSSKDREVAKSAPMAAEAAAGDLADYDAAAYEESYEAEAPANGEGSETVGEGAGSSRKLITTVNINAETDDVEALAANLERKVKGLGGYVESSNIYSDNTSYGNNTSKSADITARIPADKLDSFLNDVEGSSNITSRSRNTEDVTLNYTDTEAHERALELEQQSLERMMGMAESVEDVMAIQSQLTDVRYRLDSIRSQLRTYDDKINYSTVYLSLRETKKFTVTEEETVMDRIKNGFADNLMSVMDALAEFLIWVITHIPALIVFAVIVLLIIFVIRRIAAAGKRRKTVPVKKMPQVSPSNIGEIKAEKPEEKQKRAENEAAEPQVKNED